MDLPGRDELTIQNLYYVIYNGAGILYDYLKKTNDLFMADVYSDGEGLIKGILYFTWILCICIFALTFAIIPFFFRIETL
jgi:hypothetical protein